MSNPDDPLGLIGVTVADKYRILEVAGDGGFSVVYKAEHLIWKAPVAIKFFNVLADADAKTREKLLEDFVLEGKLMSELSSRSAAIVQARDIGKLDTPGGEWMPYMVLEWIDGTPLDLVVAAEARAGMQARDLVGAMSLLEPVAVALDVAHKRGVAHRDLKPANIMVTGDPSAPDVSVKVLDFGIAKVMAEQVQLQQQLQLTGAAVTAFTPNYGAPEQFSRNYGATGPWTDVYAMALILVEVMRNGERALTGGTFFELGVASCDPNSRPTPGSVGLLVHASIDAVFAKALAIHPAERYASMGEFWSALHALVFPGADTWRSRTTRKPIVVPQGTQAIGGQAHTSGAASLPTAVSTSGGSSSVGIIVGAVVGVLVVGGGVAAFVTLKSDGDIGIAADANTSASAPTATATASAAASAPAVEWDGPCPKGMKLVSGGSFTMGSDDDSFKLWKPAHNVQLDTYCLDVNEVTVAKYKSCVDAGDCEPADKRAKYPKAGNATDEEHKAQLDAFSEHCNWGKSERDNHPINCLDWYRADAYCKKHTFRLPTEAQWEFAARGTDGRQFPWGNDPGNETYMNAAGSEWSSWLQSKGLPEPNSLMYEASDGFAGTAPVGKYPRGQTQAGQLDMVGNVWEWTNDWYALYKAEDATNPKGPGAGDRKAIRGGGFNGEFAVWVNPAARYHQLATASVHAIGFRCAAGVKPAD